MVGFPTNAGRCKSADTSSLAEPSTQKPLVRQQTLEWLSESKRHSNAHGEGRHTREQHLFFPAHSTAADSFADVSSSRPIVGHATADNELLRRQLSYFLCVTLRSSLV